MPLVEFMYAVQIHSHARGQLPQAIQVSALVSLVINAKPVEHSSLLSFADYHSTVYLLTHQPNVLRRRLMPASHLPVRNQSEQHRWLGVTGTPSLYSGGALGSSGPCAGSASLHSADT